MKRTSPWTVDWLAAAAVALVIASSSILAAQDFTVQMKSEDSTISTSYVSHNAVRKTMPDLDQDVINRLDQGKIIYLDHKQKTYTEITPAEARQQIGKMTDDMPAEQKEAMRRMGLSAAPTVTKLGAGETIAGYATEKYLIKMPIMEMDLSVAPALELPPAYYDLFALAGGQAGVLGDMSQFGEAMKKIKGMVLKQVTTVILMNKVTFTEVATSVEKGTIPPSTFEVPAGYKAASKK